MPANHTTSSRNVSTIFAATAFAALLSTSAAHASSADITFFAPGVTGSLVLTYDTTPTTANPDPTDPKYSTSPDLAYRLTGISGTFSDSNNGLNLDAAITGLVAVQPTSPGDPGNTGAPHDFSFLDPIFDPNHVMPSANLVPGTNFYALSYDNLYWPNGAPTTAWVGYPFGGGPLDVYGLMFTIAGGDKVNVWFNGPQTTAFGYAVVGTNVDGAMIGLDYGAAPEPSTWAMMALGFVGLGLAGYRQNRPRPQTGG